MGELRYDGLVVLDRLALAGAGAGDLLSHAVKSPCECAEIIRPLVFERHIKIALCDLCGKALELFKRAENIQADI